MRVVKQKIPKTREQKDRFNIVRNVNRNNKRKYIYNYLLTHPCKHCGEDRPVCLEFHHKNPTTKKFSL